MQLKLYPALMRTATPLLVSLWPGETCQMFGGITKGDDETAGGAMREMLLAHCKVTTEFVTLHPLQLHK